MQDLPHVYTVSTRAEGQAALHMTTPGAPAMAADAPAEFGGPGDQWSPEALLVASVGSCFVLSFRAIARASKFEWKGLSCDVSGTLERVERVTRFTSFEVTAVLTVGSDAEEAKAMRLLEKAKAVCLITNSLSATTALNATVQRQAD